MKTKFFTFDIVGYDVLEGGAFSNTGHFELSNPPCDIRVFQPHMYGAHIEFYSDGKWAELITKDTMCCVTIHEGNKVSKRTWNDYDVIKVKKHLVKHFGKEYKPGAEIILPNLSKPNWLGKAQSGFNFVSKLLRNS